MTGSLDDLCEMVRDDAEAMYAMGRLSEQDDTTLGWLAGLALTADA